MDKLCKRIEIESSYGWGSQPQLSDKIIIYPNRVFYEYKIERMGKLIETGSNKMLPDAFDDIESELELSKLFKYVNKTEFKIRNDITVLDGGTFLMTLYYNDDSKEEIRAPGEDFKDVSKELSELLRMLSIILRSSSIRPVYLDEFRNICYEDLDDDFKEEED